MRPYLKETNGNTCLSLDQHKQVFLLFPNCNKNHVRNLINVIYRATVPHQVSRKVSYCMKVKMLIVTADAFSRSVPIKGNSRHFVV